MSKKSRTFAADLVIPKAYSMNRTIFVIMVLVLSSAFSPALAADIKHNFDDKFRADPKELSVYDKNTKATTNDGYTYTCSGKAEFGMDHTLGTKICIKLLNSDDYFTVSPAIDNLAEVTIWYISNASDCTACTNINVYISSDNSSWGLPLSAPRVNYYTGCVIATIPKGKHYVKILNSSGSKELSITQITYTTSDCNCFQYIPE